MARVPWELWLPVPVAGTERWRRERIVRNVQLVMIVFLK
jgi:hypothetical protein